MLAATAATLAGGQVPALGQEAARPGVAEPRSQNRRARILIDTDAGNYHDDQFALAYALTSSEALQVDAVYAAPFVNRRVSSAGEGMQRSFDEIHRVLRASGHEGIPVRKGAGEWLPSADEPVRSPAAEDLADRVMNTARPVDYVVAIGPATNLASAMLLEPGLASRTTVVWLGGTPHHFPSASEFNLRQDPLAVRHLLSAGSRLMHVPAEGVAEYLSSSQEELENRMRDSSRIGNYLLRRMAETVGQTGNPTGRSRTYPLWDVVPVAWLVNSDWVPATMAPSPVLGRSLQWSHSPYRHRIRVAYRLKRDEIFTDLFRKLSSAPA